MAPLRILLADDHTMVRQGLRKVLEERPEWQVVAEAGDGREAVRLAELHKPDVAVLDVAMPLLNGIEATRQIAKRVPHTRDPRPEHALRRGLCHPDDAGGGHRVSAQGLRRRRSAGGGAARWRRASRSSARRWRG